MKSVYAVLIAVILALPYKGVWAGSDAGHGAMTGGMDLKKYDVRFNSLDTGGDGALSWEEYNADFKDSDRKVFDALDTDGSGAVEQKEWHDFKAAHGMAGPAQGGKGRYHQGELPDPAPYMVHMGDIDKDEDDALSWEEFKGHFPKAEKPVFEAIDVNRDSRVNRIRRENPALHSDRSLRFHPVDNQQLICYSKRTEDASNMIIVVVNLDPHHTQSGWLELPLADLEIDAEHPFQAHDLLGEGRFLWNGPRNFVELDPRVCPAHVFRVRKRVRSESQFEYFL